MRAYEVEYKTLVGVWCGQVIASSLQAAVNEVCKSVPVDVYAVCVDGFWFVKK